MPNEVFNYTLVDTNPIHVPLDLSKSDSYYIGIGKATPWDETWGEAFVSDDNPPEPNRRELAIPEPIYFKRIQQALYVDVTGKPEDYNWGESNEFSFTRQVESTHVYIKAHIEGQEYNESSFRAIGFYTRLVFENTVLNNNCLGYSADKVRGGTLYWLAYHSPVVRFANKDHYIELMFNLNYDYLLI